MCFAGGERLGQVRGSLGSTAGGQYPIAILARRGRTYVKVQDVPTGRIPEGAAFSPDGRYLLVQCHPAREIWVYEVDGERVTDTGHRIATPGMPSSLRAADKPL